MASYVPNGRQQFCDSNGKPLALGTVGMYVVGTLTPKNTWQDSGATELNTDPISLDAGGYATIYGSGQYRQIVKDALGNVIYDDVVGDVDSAIRSDLASDTGSSLVNFTAAGTGAVSRTAQEKLRETVSVKDRGAVGDGVTDDTAAFQAALTYAQTNRVDLYIPAGIYICAALTFNSTSETYMPRIYGSGRVSTILKKKTGSGTGPVLTVGGSADTNHEAGVRIEHLTIDGVSSAESAQALLLYNPVRCTIDDVSIKNAGDLVTFLGGVDSKISNFVLGNGTRGLVADTFSGSAGTNYPNNHAARDGVITDCTSLGLSFDNGRALVVDRIDFNNCGSSGDATTGALCVGPNIDVEGGSDEIGAMVTNCWFEGNAGKSSIILLSGRNNITRPNFIDNPNATYDIYVDGGTYELKDGKWATPPKTPAVFEDTATGSGNSISDCPDLGSANVTITAAKTELNHAGRSYTVSTLPTPILLARAFVSDSTVAASGNFGATLTGGGANKVPVYYDGAAWRIG